MTLEEAIFGLLSADAGVAALLGATPGTRLYPNDKVPEGTAGGYATYRMAGREYADTLKGQVPTNLYDLRVECYAATYSAVCAVATAITDALRNYSGVIGGNTVRVLGAFHEDEEDAYFPLIDDGEDGVHQRGLTLRIWWRPNS